MNKWTIALIGLCFLSSCSNQKNEQSKRIEFIDSTVSASVQRHKLSLFNDSLNNLFSNSPEELTSILGNPKNTKIEQYENIHNKDIDTIYTIDFDSVSISLYSVSAQKRYLLINAEVRENSLINILGLNLGDSDIVVKNKYGTPDKSEIDSTGVNILMFVLNEDAEEYTMFYFKDSKLIKLMYQPYID